MVSSTSSKHSRRPRYLGKTLQVVLGKKTEVFTCQVLELSSFSMALRSSSQHGKLVTPRMEATVRVHEHDVELCSFQGVIAQVDQSANGAARIVVEYAWAKSVRSDWEHGLVWYDCSDIFPVAAFCEDPFFFGERIFLRVQKISRDGLFLIGSARNKSFMPNLTLLLTVQLPGVVTTTIPVRVVHVQEIDGGNRFEVITSFSRLNPLTSALLAEYLLLTGSAKKADLDAQNLNVRRIRTLLEFRFVANSRDMERVLRLRRSMATGVSCEAPGTLDELRSYTDGFDGSSRQAFVVMSSDVVAAVRILFPGKQLDGSELHEIVIDFPTWLRHNRFVEASRFVWSGDIRERDVFLFALRSVARITLETEHRYLVVHVPASMTAICRELGFEELRVQYRSQLPKCSHQGTEKPAVLWLDLHQALGRTAFTASRLWEIFYSQLGS